jgi:V/A-type H+-transporting ATPase subunit C
MVALIERINIMDSYQYAYLTTRISGMKNRLITQEKFRQMLNCKSLDEIPHFLENTDYKKIPYKNLEESNKILDECFVQLLDKICVFAPSAVKDCVFVLKEYTKLQDLKSMIKFNINDDKIFTDILSQITGIQKNVTDLNKIKEFKKFKKNILNHLEKKEFSQIDYKLENRFFKSIKKIIDKRNLAIVKNFIKKRADIINITIKLRSLLIGYDTDCYLDYGFIEPTKIKNQKNIESFISSIIRTEYHMIFSKIMDEFNKNEYRGIFDDAMDKFLMEFSKNAKSSDPFGLGLVFWFILTKDREVRKLKAVIKIISDGLTKDYFEVFAW